MLESLEACLGLYFYFLLFLFYVILFLIVLFPSSVLFSVVAIGYRSLFDRRVMQVKLFASLSSSDMHIRLVSIER